MDNRTFYTYCSLVDNILHVKLVVFYILIISVLLHIIFLRSTYHSSFIVLLNGVEMKVEAKRQKHATMQDQAV